MRTLTLAAIIAATTVCVGGCFTVGPNYSRPEVSVPATWRIDLPQAEEVANTAWWEQFQDPVLNALIQTALRDNLDVRIAAARVDQFAGLVRATRSQGLPQIGYGANVSRSRTSEVGMPPLSPALDPIFNLYQGTLSAAWQVDLFGRVRRLTEAAQAQVFASEQAQRGVVLSLVTGVATSYITLRGLDRQLEVARATARIFAETLRIFELRYRDGLVSETELSQVRSQYKLALSTIPAVEQQIAIVENGISILLGQNPGPIPRGKSISELVLPSIPSDLPSTLLGRRPDILQAEQNLVAANANVGAARALYYPTISLTGALGSVSTAFGDFLSGPAALWSIAAGVTGPIFTAGAIEGQVQSTEAQKRQAELVYRQTILGAFSDTNNALIGAQKTSEQTASQQERVDALREYARLSNLKFEDGLIGYLEVLVSENDLFAAELSLASLQAARFNQVIGVYQSVGGGWVDIASSLSSVPLSADRTTGLVQPK
ncbi:efflux transporter outer membrane subunit [Paraburkholderia sp. MMS20-SJTR3]|uniref:Efflux transporter outer membrane subunit n=1 Tax=Paraburkholderia sejongensis TaxID=2886946 RepID=A0ABS8K3V9_9BURK|nr:efflux transporter outer membrane subunit [Paraburkholderia sp. MMS20-SJTR3]MCC8396848.1 efflux transporter outer membrane subunit [Paraburkholderia sp. MMS20-SJTR3]